MPSLCSRSAATLAAVAVLAATTTLLACTPGSASMAAPAPAAAVHAGDLAPTPPMGWNSWNKFGCRIDEDLIHQTADAMVSTGMKAAGYEYVNIDDCWEAPQRDANGNLTTDPQRFPHGMKALADYVHAKGLKLGIYSSAGTGTCQRRPASLDHEVADARTFASWGIDYLKYDNCNNGRRPAVERYRAMGEALAATGRPIVFSLCEWGYNEPWLWGRSVGGNLWRTTGDISDSWQAMLRNLDQQVGLEAYSGPNHWNDPDMLEVGNGHMTNTEYVAHFSLWALLNAPLIAGNDLRSMDDSTRMILTNHDVIAVDQDWGGMQGHRVRSDGRQQVWVKPMSNGDRAVVLLNIGTAPAAEWATADEIGLAGTTHQARNLWTHQDTTFTGRIEATIPSHGVVMYLVHK